MRANYRREGVCRVFAVTGADFMGTIAPTAKKLWGDALKSPPRKLSIFWNSKMSQSTKGALISVRKCTKIVWRLDSARTAGDLRALPRPLAVFQGYRQGQEKGRGKDRGNREEGTGEGGFSAKNCTKSVWRPGSAGTRWGSLQHSPDP